MYYFEKCDEDNSLLFKDLDIWKQGERYLHEQGRYPVVFINLKDIKYDNYDFCLKRIKMLIATEYLRHD
jgi:hypothetical protein